MYCNKCGKWIDYDASTCVECQEAELQKTYAAKALHNGAQEGQDFATQQPAFQGVAEQDDIYLDKDYQEAIKQVVVDKPPKKEVVQPIRNVQSPLKLAISALIEWHILIFMMPAMSYLSDSMFSLLLAIVIPITGLISSIQALKGYFVQKREGDNSVAALVISIIDIVLHASTILYASIAFLFLKSLF